MQIDADAAVLRYRPPPTNSNDDFARLIQRTERSYRGTRLKEYVVGLSAAVALCPLD